MSCSSTWQPLRERKRNQRAAVAGGGAPSGVLRRVQPLPHAVHRKANTTDGPCARADVRSVGKDAFGGIIYLSAQMCSSQSNGTVFISLNDRCSTLPVIKKTQIFNECKSGFFAEIPAKFGSDPSTFG
jgi:hypothetical protein